MTAVDQLRRFVAFAQKIPVALPDRASMGIADLTAGEVRQAMKAWRDDISEQEAIEALKPFAIECVPDYSKYWPFGCSGLEYGDFIRARELTQQFSQTQTEPLRSQ